MSLTKQSFNWELSKGESPAISPLSSKEVNFADSRAHISAYPGFCGKKYWPTTLLVVFVRFVEFAFVLQSHSGKRKAAKLTNITSLQYLAYD